MLVLIILKHGSLGPDCGIFIPKEEGPEPAEKQVDWLYARDQQDQPADFYSMPNYTCY